MQIIAIGYSVQMKNLSAKPTFLFPNNVVEK